MENNKYKGYLFVGLSILLFSLMTMVVRIISISSEIPAIEMTLFRFIFGFIFVNYIKFKYNKKITPIDKKVLYGRAIFNTLAVILFFVTIELSTVTKANIYNLTYPVFVAIFAPFFLDENLTIKKFLIVLLGFFGTFLVSEFNSQSINMGDFTGILAGITAGMAIVYLRKARLTEDSFTILYYLMSIGLISTTIMSVFTFVTPNFYDLALLFSVGILSFGGQYCITYGYKYVSAVEGAIISSGRIFVATLLGVVFLGEILTLNIFVGGIIIFISIILISRQGI